MNRRTKNCASPAAVADAAGLNTGISIISYIAGATTDAMWTPIPFNDIYNKILIIEQQELG